MRAVGVVDEVAGSDQRTEQCTQDAAVFDRWFHTAAGGTNHASSAPPGTTQSGASRGPGEAEKVKPTSAAQHLAQDLDGSSW